MARSLKEAAAKTPATTTALEDRLQREVNRLSRELAKVRSTEAEIARAVTSALQEEGFTPEPLPVPKAFRGKRHEAEEIAVLHISDVQFGKVTETYNSTVAEARLGLLAERTVQITNLRRTNSRIRKAIVLLGGDMVEGEDIFEGQSHLIDCGVFTQAVRLAKSLCGVIRRLAEEFDSIEVSCVTGNHGRNGKGASPGTNWDAVCYRMMADLLLGPEWEKHKIADRVSVSIPPRFWDVVYAFDWGLLQVHGDQIRGGFAGFPWYGTAKKAWGWIDTIPSPWDYLFFGHFHTYASAVLNHRTFLANGSTESDNDYAQEQLAAGGFPCQRLAYFSPSHGLIADNQVFLDNTRRPQRLKHR